MDNYYIKTADISQAERLYSDFIEPYFPENEKKPLSSILRMMETGLYKILYVEEEGKVCGVEFLTTYPGGEVYLLDYLAVAQDERSKGYGGILLSACREYTEGKPVIIETENIDYAKNEEERLQRIRRNDFYKRNGAVLTGVRTNIFEARYLNWILSADTVMDDSKVERELVNIYRFMVTDKKLYERYVEIPEKKN